MSEFRCSGQVRARAWPKLPLAMGAACPRPFAIAVLITLILKSGTRKEELLLSKMGKTKSNGEFLNAMSGGKG